jgi:hydroxymethylpyrimidine pyrophosphatase-like HAD family hydrolase
MTDTTRLSGYDGQLLALEDTYAHALAADAGPLRDLLAAVRGQPCIFVGSGGAFAVARLAADLHERRTRTFARSATPLELESLIPSLGAAMVVFSAGARHTDTRRAIQAAARAGVRPIGLVTHRDGEDLGALRNIAKIVSLPLANPDGFLATHSTLTMATMLVRATIGDEALPPGLPALHGGEYAPLRRSVVLLTAPGYRAVATDLETRIAETGVAHAQVTDYRNFAHGRHHGLSRHLADTTVVALIEPGSERLAAATLRELPAETHVVRLETNLDWPSAVLDLLVASMRLIAPTARREGIDPSRPRVPEFGRRLYHLRAGSTHAPAFDGVARKLAALGLLEHTGLRLAYEDALAEWLAALQAERIGGLVLDYDGTVCRTDDRFDPPDAAVQERIVALLEAGLVLGFASGRGSSLHSELRGWVPSKRWADVELGLYNGGLLLRLDEEVAGHNGRARDLGEIEESLRSGPFSGLVEVESRDHQIGVQSRTGGSVSLDVLAQLATELAARTPDAALKAVASAHSVDIVPAASSKRAVLERVSARADGTTIAIGDQGQLGGNDFELLAATPFSLSVDRCSGDPTRCWNLDARGRHGPQLLQRYLAALKLQRSGVRFRWPHSR